MQQLDVIGSIFPARLPRPMRRRFHHDPDYADDWVEKMRQLHPNVPPQACEAALRFIRNHWRGASRYEATRLAFALNEYGCESFEAGIGVGQADDRAQKGE